MHHITFTAQDRTRLHLQVQVSSRNSQSLGCWVLPCKRALFRARELVRLLWFYLVGFLVWFFFFVYLKVKWVINHVMLLIINITAMKIATIVCPDIKPSPICCLPPSNCQHDCGNGFHLMLIGNKLLEASKQPSCMKTSFSPFTLSGRGRGRGRSRTDEDEEGGGRPSGPSTLFDFLESKMGAFSIDGESWKCSQSGA